VGGVVCTETVDEVAQLMNAAFADVLQVLSQAELNSILNTRVLAGSQTPQQTRSTGI